MRMYWSRSFLRENISWRGEKKSDSQDSISKWSLPKKNRQDFSWVETGLKPVNCFGGCLFTILQHPYHPRDAVNPRAISRDLLQASKHPLAWFLSLWCQTNKRGKPCVFLLVQCNSVPKPSPALNFCHLSASRRGSQMPAASSGQFAAAGVRCSQ